MARDAIAKTMEGAANKKAGPGEPLPTADFKTSSLRTMGEPDSTGSFLAQYRIRFEDYQKAVAKGKDHPLGAPGRR